MTDDGGPTIGIIPLSAALTIPSSPIQPLVQTLTCWLTGSVCPQYRKGNGRETRVELSSTVGRSRIAPGARHPSIQVAGTMRETVYVGSFGERHRREMHVEPG